jgi:hypothetical protein
MMWRIGTLNLRLFRNSGTYDALKMTSLGVALSLKAVISTAVVVVLAKSRVPDGHAMMSRRISTRGRYHSIHKVT